MVGCEGSRDVIRQHRDGYSITNLTSGSLGGSLAQTYPFVIAKQNRPAAITHRAIY